MLNPLKHHVALEEDRIPKELIGTDKKGVRRIGKLMISRAIGDNQHEGLISRDATVVSTTIPADATEVGLAMGCDGFTGAAGKLGMAEEAYAAKLLRDHNHLPLPDRIKVIVNKVIDEDGSNDNVSLAHWVLIPIWNLG